MADREKIIKAYEDFVNGYECFCTSDDYEYEMHKAVLALLKEQEDMGKELTDAMELVHKKNARIIELTDLLKEQEAVVRCKDCKHLGYTNSHWFCKWMNRCVDEDWFCADGEAKT